MTNTEALLASNDWWLERKTKGAHHFITKSIPLLFQTLDALYLETRKLPLISQSGRMNLTINDSYTWIYGIHLKQQDYATLRSILSLSGDVYELLNPLKNLNSSQLQELEIPIMTLYKYSDRFREIRNFFTHLGEAITDMNRHGVSGPLYTKSGITYAPSAQHCVHLVWDNNTIFFTYNKIECDIVIDKPAYDPIFTTARQIFAEITSHKLNAGMRNYTPPNHLFP